jgi:hypothetical protein
MGKGRGKATNWSEEEDEVLCRAYMAVSEDRKLGTSQTQKKLWDTVELEYNDKLPRGAIKRPAKGLSARYASIAKNVTKFASMYIQVQNAQPSDLNENDMVERAKEIFKDVEKKDFKYLHCWVILRNYNKFMGPLSEPPRPTNLGIRKRKEPEGGEGTDDINDSLEKDRPGGTKEAKMSKLTDMQRMNIMRVDVEANRSITQSQQQLAQLKEQELHMREEELQQQKRQSNDAYFAYPRHVDNPERQEYDKRRNELALKEVDFELRQLKTMERGKQKVEEPIVEPELGEPFMIL